ncbi:MAG: MFS transporter [Methanobacteriaceae archaeon]|nr:MFS transporter [Methanobacteriaceae archaeon]
MGYLICGKCKSYYKLKSDESPEDFVFDCECGGKLRYVENLDIIDPNWKQVDIQKKPPIMEILREKIKSIFTLPHLNMKKRWADFWNKLRYRLYRSHDWHQNQGPYYDMGMNPLYSLKNELNLRNIQWPLVIPAVIAITLILTFTPGIMTLLTFILLLAVGYFFNNQIIGVKNAIITGAISFFLGSLFTGSYLLIIPFTLLGGINGAVCGWIGGYLRKIRYQRGI